MFEYKINPLKRVGESIVGVSNTFSQLFKGCNWSTLQTAKFKVNSEHKINMKIDSDEKISKKMYFVNDLRTKFSFPGVLCV